MNALNLWIAFIAGLVSFLSPCVLPLIPGYLSFLAGSSLKDAKNHRFTIFFTSVFFVLGFSVVFAALGVILNSVLPESASSIQTWVSRIGGSLIIFFGLLLTGLIRLDFLQREYKFTPRFQFASRKLTAFTFGAAFAAGWTPCVGPVLGTILTLAATEPGSSFTLLMCYSLGLGVPFLIVGFFANEAADFIRRWVSIIHWVNVVFGFLLIVLGVFVFTENLPLLANFSLLNKLLLP
jgi:cytochrome c-type biogenesis protein